MYLSMVYTSVTRNANPIIKLVSRMYNHMRKTTSQPWVPGSDDGAFSTYLV